MQRIYLDYAAATPVDKRVVKSMLPYFSDIFYNPSAIYHGALMAKKDLETARHIVAIELGAKSSEIIFTAGGTESTNLAISGIMNQYPEGEIIISAIEHDAVLIPSQNFTYKIAPVDENGKLKLDELKKLITDKTVLISLILASNEIGTIQPIKEISNFVKQIQAERKLKNSKIPIYLHTDACQAPLYIDVNVSKLGVDLMTLNGGKIHGPKQSGILYKKYNVVLIPIITGGGQEWGFRSGTENVAFAIGFSNALQLASKGRVERVKKMVELRNYFMDKLENEFNCSITGSRVNRAANNIHVIFSGVDNERVLFSLDNLGVDASAGSACSASSDTPSTVLLAIGKTPEEARNSIRFSLGKSTTKQKIDDVIEKLKIAVKA